MIESLSGLREQPLSTHRTNYDFEQNDPRRLHHLSIEQQKKRAKELLKQWCSRQPDALERGGRSLSARSMADTDKLKLSDAQHVIAREHHFKNWADFKAHVEHTRIEHQVIKNGKPVALDADKHTLHIRCGSDIQHALSVAGFVGDFMSFADPYVQGPVPHTDTLEAFIDIRAQFLTDAFNVPNARERLEQDYAGLASAKDYKRVAIWLEHDSYDQLILARLLDYFSDKANRPEQLQFICVTHFPGVKIFNGIGHLPPEAMRVLWCQFCPVENKHLQLGSRVWQAITSQTPEPLQQIVEQGTEAIPTMAIALRRHLQELPSTHNGLSLTEQLTLQILADKGPMNAARLFGWYTNHYEPLTFMGDTGYWLVIGDLASAAQPAIEIHRQGEKPKDWQVKLTQTGENLLANQADWIDLNGIDRWTGGVRLDSTQGSVWRFDKESGLRMDR